MGRTKAAERLFESTGSPPDNLGPNEFIACIVKARGNSLYDVKLATSQSESIESLHQINRDGKGQEETIVVSMPPKFRNTIFVKRGGFVLIALFDDTPGTVKGEIINIVVNKKDWQRFPYWPQEFKEPERSYEIELSDSDSDHNGDDEQSLG